MANVARFEVFANGTLIGHSNLENGDPPMGVASGRFFPQAAYSAIQPAVIAARYSPQKHLQIAVRLNGTVIPSEGEVRIGDYSAELDELEIEVLGIGYPLYEELFPAQVIAYRTQFSK